MTLPSEPGRRVLLADDERMVREIVCLLLVGEGYSVDTAADGAEALARFNESPPDLVITDRAMPHLTGDELASEIKRISPTTPVVMITGMSSPPQAGHTKRAADIVVRKPFTRDILLAAIDTARRQAVA